MSECGDFEPGLWTSQRPETGREYNRKGKQVHIYFSRENDGVEHRFQLRTGEGMTYVERGRHAGNTVWFACASVPTDKVMAMIQKMEQSGKGCMEHYTKVHMEDYGIHISKEPDRLERTVRIEIEF